MADHTHGLPQRFIDKLDIGDCWEWTAVKDSGGYARFKFGGTMVSAHRFAYQTLVGPIDSNLECDHLCKNQACVNPDHIDVVTHLENVRRSNHWHRNQTHCQNGHEFNDANTYTYPDGKRECRPCRRAYQNKRNHVRVRRLREAKAARSQDR